MAKQHQTAAPSEQPFFAEHAEQSVLGALLIDPHAYDNVTFIKSDDFYLEAHRLIFSKIGQMLEVGHPVDAVTVAESLDLDGLAEKTGGLGYLGDLAHNTPSALNVVGYAKIVKERAEMRKLSSAAMAALQMANAPGAVPSHERASAIRATLESIELSTDHPRPMVVGDLLHEHIAVLQQRMEGDLPAQPTGFPDVDKFIIGLREGQLIIVGARPGMGKTSFTAQITFNAARDGLGVLFLSMEMSRIDIADRLVASVGAVPLDRIMRGQLSDDELTRVTAAYSVLEGMKFYIDDQGSLTLADVASKLRNMIRMVPELKLVVIDYIQLMAGPGDNRNSQLEQISRGLKGLAKHFGITIVVLSQLSREVEKRTSKRPVASDLKDSGSLEADADIIMFLYRDELYHPDTQDRGIAEVIISKNRNGQPGVVCRLTFEGEYTRFGSLTYM